MEKIVSEKRKIECGLEDTEDRRYLCHAMTGMTGVLSKYFSKMTKDKNKFCGT